MKNLGIYYVLALAVLPLAGCATDPADALVNLIHPGHAKDRVSSTFAELQGEGEIEVGDVKVIGKPESIANVVHNEQDSREGITQATLNTFTYQWDELGGVVSMNGDITIDNTRRALMVEHLSDNQRAIVESVASGAMEALTAGMPAFLDFLKSREAAGQSNGPLLEYLGSILPTIAGIPR